MAQSVDDPPGFRWLLQLLRRHELSASHLQFLDDALRTSAQDAVWVASDGESALAWNFSLEVVLDRLEGTQRDNRVAVAFVSLRPNSEESLPGALYAAR